MGHWKAECPKRFENASEGKTATTAFTGNVLTKDGFDDMILIDDPGASPNQDAACADLKSVLCFHSTVHPCGETGSRTKSVWGLGDTLHQHAKRLNASLRRILMPSPSPLTQEVRASMPPAKTTGYSSEDALFVSFGPCGIVDLGASQTVIGEAQVQDLLQTLPTKVHQLVKRIPCNTVFRFGNSSTVTRTHAFLVPLDRWYVKICVVPSSTPFLISNNVFCKLGAIIDTQKAEVRFSKLDITMPLSMTDRKLFLLDFGELIRRACQTKGAFDSPQPIARSHVLHSTHTEQSIPKMSQVSVSEVMRSEGQLARTSSCASTVVTLMSDSMPDISSPETLFCPPTSTDRVPDHAESLGSSLSGSNPPAGGDSGGGRVPSPLTDGTAQPQDLVWHSEERDDLQGGMRLGSPVCGLVCQHVRGFHQALPQEVPPLREPVHGTLGDPERGETQELSIPRDNAQESCPAKICGEGQDHIASGRTDTSDTSIVADQPSQSPQSQRDVGIGWRRDRASEPAHQPDRDGHGPGCSAAANPDHSAVRSLGAVRIAEKTRSPPTEFEEQPTDREQTCQILDALQSIQPDAIDSEYAEANLFHLPTNLAGYPEKCINTGRSSMVFTIPNIKFIS